MTMWHFRLSWSHMARERFYCLCLRNR